MSEIASLVKSHLGVHPDFPKKGITFLDIFPLFRDPVKAEMLVTAFLNHIFTNILPSLPNNKIDVVVGLDARGFLLGPLLAMRLGAGFTPVRKPGKLPGECIETSFKKEYGEDKFEMQTAGIERGQNVLIVDDLIATGGSAYAAGDLVSKLGGNVVSYLFVVGLPFLKGADKLNAPSWWLVEAED